MGEALLVACTFTNTKELIEGKDALLNWVLYKAPQNEKGVQYYLNTSKQFWVNSMYMLPLFLAAADYYGKR